jgi:hypothetical protein
MINGACQMRKTGRDTPAGQDSRKKYRLDHAMSDVWQPQLFGERGKG